jgi:hypothetical protein
MTCAWPSVATDLQPDRERSAVFGASRKSLAITGRIVCSPQIGLDSKTLVLIVLCKNAYAVGMLSVKAVLAMIEGLALKIIGLANIYTGMRSAAFGICLPLGDNVHRCNRFESSLTRIRGEGVVPA